MNIRKIEMRKRRFLKPWRFLVQAAGSLYLVPRILRAPLSLGLPSYSSSQPLQLLTYQLTKAILYNVEVTNI